MAVLAFLNLRFFYDFELESAEPGEVALTCNRCDWRGWGWRIAWGRVSCCLSLCDDQDECWLVMRAVTGTFSTPYYLYCLTSFVIGVPVDLQSRQASRTAASLVSRRHTAQQPDQHSETHPFWHSFFVVFVVERLILFVLVAIDTQRSGAFCCPDEFPVFFFFVNIWSIARQGSLSQIEGTV